MPRDRLIPHSSSPALVAIRYPLKPHLLFARIATNTTIADFPAHWVEQAIPYGQLKKCLKKVQRELQDLGLDSETLRSLIDPENTSSVAIKYRLQGKSESLPQRTITDTDIYLASGDSKLVRPTLTVDVHFENGVVVDASLTRTSRRFLQNVASELASNRHRMSNDTTAHTTEGPSSPATPDSPLFSTTEHAHYETIEVPLVFDNQFFQMLQSDVSNFDTLLAEEQRSMTNEIIELRKEIAVVSKPSRFSTTDLARWRRIFELYLDAEIFFATSEQNHGSRTSQSALKQLQWFQNEVEKRNLAHHFGLRESHLAFARFLKLNAILLKNLQFQELNQTAVFKILKSES